MYGALALAAPGDAPGDVYFGLLGGSLVTALGFALAARRLPLQGVLRGSLVFDTLLIAAMSAAIERAELVAIGYFWPLAFAAFLLGSRDTLIVTVLSAGCAAVVGGSAADVDALTQTTNVMLLTLIGLVLAGLSGTARSAQTELARERTHDAAALRIAERVRSSLDLEAVLGLTLEEVGRATDASRCVLRLAADRSGSMRLLQWHGAGLPDLDLPSPPAPVLRVFERRHPVVIRDAARTGGEEREFAEKVGAASLIVYPVQWQDRVVAALGLTDGRPRDWEQDVVPLLRRVGPQIGAALVQAELFAQQVEAVDRLEDLARMREQLVANVSHELRTPLTSTIGFLRTLEREDLTMAEEEQRRFLGIARAEAERLGRLVEDLLELARTERAVLPLRPAAVRVAEIARRAASGAPAATGDRVRVEIGDGVLAHADPDRLLQVLSNLIANALFHGAGTVTVAGAADGERVVLEVGDEGSGVPRERVPELFVPFTRWGDSGSGTGLGLAIARALVEAHGGSLVYRSAENGRSHAFVISLPGEHSPTGA